MAKITVIPPTISLETHLPDGAATKRRVAGYARVSTDSDEQFTSYEAQIEYYTRRIKSNPEWEFVKVYSDEGLSGTSTKGREGFNEMIDDAMGGKIDLILTKSVSRFARNTVDSLSIIRKLKERGVECFFEKENIYTFDSKGELLITIMSSLAQEESRSISENVTWGFRKSFESGKVRVNILGYGKGADGKPSIDEEGASTVRAIYRMFLAGMTATGIAKALREQGRKTSRGGTKWQTSTVQSILTNEKYKGDALLQKTYTTDFLTHKAKKNDGEVQQFYVENSHPAIIDPSEWEAVQSEIERRGKNARKFSGKSPLCGKLVCADCGSFYGPKVWHSTNKFRKTVWQCNSKFGGGDRCQTPTLTEASIKAAFVRAFNRLAADKLKVSADVDKMAELMEDTAGLEAKMKKAKAEMLGWQKQAQDLVMENAAHAKDQKEYQDEYGKVSEAFKAASAEYDSVSNEIISKKARAKAVRLFAESFAKLPDALAEWDADIWGLCLQEARVERDGTIDFLFRGGETISEKTD